MTTMPTWPRKEYSMSFFFFPKWSPIQLSTRLKELNFREQRVRRKALESGWDVKRGPHTIYAEMGGVVDDHFTNLTSPMSTGKERKGTLFKNLSEQRREPRNSTHIWRRVWESNPGYIGGRRVLSTLCHHFSPKNSSGFSRTIAHRVINPVQQGLSSVDWLRQWTRSFILCLPPTFVRKPCNNILLNFVRWY